MIDRLVAEDFEPLVGRTIEIVGAARPVALAVVAIARIANPTPRATPPFSVSLREAGAARSLPQGTYRFAHPTHGELELFLVPIGPDAGGFGYELTFN